MTHRAVVITISDRCFAGAAVDKSGPAILGHLAGLDASLVHRECVPDEVETIRRTVRTWVNRCEVILTTGGTGIAARDVTPEALEPLIERHLPGFGEVMRMRAFDAKPQSIVSRGGAGIVGRTLIVWMPGSPHAVNECIPWLSPAIKHICEFLRDVPPH